MSTVKSAVRLYDLLHVLCYVGCVCSIFISALSFAKEEYVSAFLAYAISIGVILLGQIIEMSRDYGHVDIRELVYTKLMYAEYRSLDVTWAYWIILMYLFAFSLFRATAATGVLWIVLL